MEITASSNQIRVSTRKVRLVADSVKSLPIEEALEYLITMRKRGGYVLEKTLRSALANATNNLKLNADDLVIKAIDVQEGPALKRFHPSTRGRVHPYKKRSSNIRIILEERIKK